MFVLRTVSVIGATLLVPAVWVLARWLVRRGVAPPTAPWWAVLFTAISPFLLWYGQEARPYTLWAMLAVLTTYLLCAPRGIRAWKGWFAGFGVAELAFLTTHYYAVFLLPLHALILFVWLARRSLAGAGAGDHSGGGGGGGRPVRCMDHPQPGRRAELLVDLAGHPPARSAECLQPRPQRRPGADLVDRLGIRCAGGCRCCVGAAVAEGVGRRRLDPAGVPPVAGWGAVGARSLPAALYQRAPHEPAGRRFLLLVGAGLGAIWRYQRIAAGAIALFLVASVAYSTVNYYTLEEYAKDDYTGLGEYMDGRIMPGDVVLFYPPSSWRIFEYYLPLEPVQAAALTVRRWASMASR